MTNKAILKEIKDYIAFNIIKYANLLNDEKLYKDGAIFYMNGNDGTRFDFEVNGHSCEFMVFYNKTEMGVISVCLNNDGSVDGYLFADGGDGKTITLSPKQVCSENEARRFIYYLAKEYDDKDYWNEIIKTIE